METKTLVEESVELNHKTLQFLKSNVYTMDDFTAAKAKRLKAEIEEFLEIKSEVTEEITSGLKPITIWMEGYKATGESSTAQALDTYMAVDFEDAIRQLKIGHPDVEVEQYERKHFTSDEAWETRRSNYKIWGCALFSNEQQARESFG